MKRSGFTLVELLVAMTVLLLILVVCAALTLEAQNLLNHGTEKMDADAQARLVFDRMTIDLTAMLKRTDVDYIVKDSTQTQAGNDSLAFYAMASGYFSPTADSSPRNKVSLLAYRINGQTYQMERLAKGTGWYTSSSPIPMVFLPGTLAGTWGDIAGLGTGGVTDLNLGTDTDYQVLADGVFRLEYCYILSDGTFSNVPYLSTANRTSLDGYGWQDVVALYVAIAVLDDKSRLLVTPGTGTNPNLTAVTTKLGDFILGSNQSMPPVTQWESVINQANFPTQANLPVPAAQAVRIFARTIPINPLPSPASL
jgi:prepilin-type N-terminal cleavage/methylation domain-containing protein